MTVENTVRWRLVAVADFSVFTVYSDSENCRKFGILSQRDKRGVTSADC
jgi:hypothetical protein